MTRASTRLRRWILAAGMALALTACGGGGGGSPAPDASAGDPPAVAADARNGTYTMVAANAREYALTVDFDARAFSVSGNGVNQTGTFTVSGDEYSFVPGDAPGATSVNTTRFRYVNDTLAGVYATPDDVQPFIAPRVFATTVADAVGTYDLVSRTVDATGAAPDDRIVQGRITADGHLETCEAIDRIWTIATCPAVSVVSGTLTVAGETFTATTPQGSYAFHVARVGDDRILLRASPSGPTTRRFTVGMPEKGSFAPGTFVGGTSEGDWGELTFDAKSISLTATASTGAATAMTGTVYPAASIQQLAAVQTADSGNFFISRSTDLGVLFAARGNALRPGFVTIGVRQ